jgi:hypothetical protein
MSRSSRFWLGAFAVAFLGLARFAAAPVVDFTLDDWALLRRALAPATFGGLWDYVIHEPDRPLGAAWLGLIFRTFGDRIVLYNLFSYAANALFVLLIMATAWELTGRGRAAGLAGLLFCLFPNLTESFNWHSMVAYSPGYIGYALSGWCWVRYARGGRPAWAFGAAAGYAIGLGTYEFGLALPVVYAVLGRARWRALWPFVGIAGLYLVWRFTQGFGTAPGVLFEPRAPDFAPATLLYNARQIVEWWAGDLMFRCVQRGFDGFVAMGGMNRRLFLLVNGLAALGVAWHLWRRAPNAPTPAGGDPFPPGAVLLFALGWAAATHAPSLVSWAAGRQNYLPAMGMAIAGGYALSRLHARYWAAAFGLFMVVTLPAVQGTAYQWKEGGVFNRRLYRHLQATHSEWTSADVVLFDTRGLRHRLSTDLLRPATSQADTWAERGNAGIIRGFGPWAMMALIQPDGVRPLSLLDVEHGAVIQEKTLTYHDRWNPVNHRTVPIDRVFIVDCYAIGAEDPRPPRW